MLDFLGGLAEVETPFGTLLVALVSEDEEGD